MGKQQRRMWFTCGSVPEQGRRFRHRAILQIMVIRQA
jgi:hypothetical protein